MSCCPDWTAVEQRALVNLARALKGLPRSIHLYTTDGEISACKQGVSALDLHHHLPGRISPGAVITDMHDHDPERMA